MTTINIRDSMIPRLDGQIAVVTGGSTGIGRATVDLLSERGAKVHILDIKAPAPLPHPQNIEFHPCDVSAWSQLSGIFLSIPRIDMVFVNAGVSESPSFLEDLEMTGEADGEAVAVEPDSPVLHVNLKGSIHCVKLAVHAMKRQVPRGGRIVLTTSSTAYMPERSLPLYSAMKLALVGLVRSLRNTLPMFDITINAVAPAATATPLIDAGFLQTIQAANLPYSDPRFVAVALVFSATATQDNPVETYGGHERVVVGVDSGQSWNGRVIVTLGDTYVEVEEPLVKLRSQWFGQWNTELTIAQQAVTMQHDGISG